MENQLLIEAIAGTIVLAALLYVISRRIRVRRLSALVYYRPRHDAVPLAAILHDIFPDAGLTAREREQLRRHGIEKGSPPWAEWIHRHKLSRLSVISKSGEAGWAGGLMLHKIHETDAHLAESISHLVRRRVEAFADLRRPSYWKANAGDEARNPATYDRQLAERFVADNLKARAHNVAFADHPAQGTSHCIIDGRAIDLGEPLEFDFQGHLEEFPGTSVLTPGDFFRQGEGLFSIDHTRGSYKLSIIGGAGLDAALGSDKALAAPQSVLASVGDSDFQNPLLTLGLSTLREIRLLKKRHTNLLTAVKNIGLDAAGTGLGSFAGAKAGATIGTAVAPGMGSVVGAIIGGISGAFAGRSISNKIKFARAETARIHYEKKILEFQQSVQDVTREAMEALEATVAREQSALGTAGLKRVRELEAFAKRIESRSRSAYILSTDAIREFFSRCEADIRAESTEIDGELGKISFSRSVLWPGAPAVRLYVQRKHVMKHLTELVAARSALLDPACSLGEGERTEVCLELFAAFGGHEAEIRAHLGGYKAITAENLHNLKAWPPGALRDLSRTRAASLRRIAAKAEQLRHGTELRLKKDVTKAKRAQNAFAKELRKLGLAL